MRFLRENMFLLSVVGVVLVLGGIMLAMDLSVGGDVSDLIAKRTKLSETLKSLAKGRKVNPEVVNAQKKWVLQTQQAFRDVLAQSTDWNRRTYKVLGLQYTDDAGQGRSMDAFPIDRERYKRFGLVYAFSRKYRIELLSLLDMMQATQVPTEAEIIDEQERMAQKLTIRKAHEERKKAREALIQRGGESALQPDRFPGKEVFPGGKFGYSGEAGVSPDVTIEAKRQGLESIRLKKALSGRIYADIESFDMVFPVEQVAAADSQLWRAQLNLWVTRDIVAAISQTNAEILDKLAPPRRNVLDSPIKRLVSIDIDEDYYTGGGSRGRGPAPGKGMAPGKMPLGGGGKFQGGDPFRGGMDPRMRALPQPSGRRTSVQAKGGPSPEELTQRVCNKMYDVVHYRFTVVMPTRYVLLLVRNLLRRNNHTILCEEIAQVSQTGSSSAVTRGGLPVGGDLYQYGVDPVAAVTLTGELLLMNSWTRGSWDEQAKRWSLPPLMPLEALQDLKERAPEAIRPEDDRRLSEQLGMMM